MKKTILSFIIVITAFLGGNLTKVNINADTTSGVTYVAEGNRVYVHFGVQTNNETHSTNMQYFETAIPESSADKKIYFDVPKNAIRFIMADYFEGESNPFVELHNIDISSSNSYRFLLDYNHYPLVFEEISDETYDLSSYQHVAFYFEVAHVEYVTEGNRVYVHVVDTMSGNNFNIDLFSTKYEEDERIIFNIPENVISINYYINDELRTYTEISEIDYFQLYWNSSDTTPEFYIYDDMDISNEKIDDNKPIYFEIDNSVVTHSDFSVVEATDRYYMHLHNFMGTNNLSNVIMITSIERINQFMSSYPEGVAFASPLNAISINIGYHSGTNAFPNYETYSPKKYELDASERYQFYLNKDDNGTYITTDSDLFAGKWYTRTSTNDYSQSIYIYFEVATNDVDPIIEPQSLIVDVSNPLTESQIRSQLTAIDDVDGDITHKIKLVGGNYESARLSNSLDIDTVYTLVYEVKDSSNNTTTATISIYLRDITEPTFGIKDLIIEVPWKNPSVFDPKDLYEVLLASDDYDDYEDLYFEVLSSNYEHEQGYGQSYSITYGVTDTSGNMGEITITIVMIDVDAPVVYGPSELTVPFANRSPLSVLLDNAGIYASDYFDTENISTTIITNQYSTATSVGSKLVVIRYTDLSGNYVDKTITINLVDMQPPILFVTPDFTIATDTVNSLTIAEIVSIIRRTQSIVSYTVLSNDYSGNENILGTYRVSLSVTDKNGNTTIVNPSILVANSEVVYHTVHFDSNGGTFVTSKTVADMTTVVVTSPKKTGFDFVGWFKDEALTQPFSLTSDVITADTTLYAKWSPVQSGGGSFLGGNFKNLDTLDILFFGGLIALGIFVTIKRKPKNKRR